MKTWKTLLALCALTALPGATGLADLTAGYRFDEAAGNTASDAFRGPTGVGSLNNFGGAQWVPGKIGNALELDGTDDFVLALNAIPSGTTVFSISMWAWADSAPVWGTLVKNWGTTLTGSFHFGFDNATGRISNYLAAPQDGPIIAPTTLTLNQWHHLALTWDAVSRSEVLYIDGVSVATRTTGVGLTSLVALGTNMSFGVKTDNTTTAAAVAAAGFWDGKYDDLAFFNHVLTPAEVAQIKANGDAGISVVVPEPGSALLALLGAAALVSRRRR